MSEEKCLELEIGWYKVVFAILAAIDVSLLGWIAQNYATTNITTRVLCYTTILSATISIIFINIRVFNCLKNREQ
ncbi:MAG: hypothetical protein AAFO09_04035 [Pseudomonadota bacterium]